MCYWSPVHEVCPNHEVVIFQPQTVTLPKPRLSRYLYKFKSSRPAPHISKHFLVFQVLYSILPPPHPQLFRAAALSLCCTCSPHLLPEQSDAHLDVAFTCQPPPFVSAPRAACLRLSPFTMTACPPLPFCPWPAHRSLLAPERFARCMSICICCPPAAPSLSAPLNPSIFCFWVSLFGAFLREGKRQGHLHPLAFSRPGTFPSPRYI